MSVGIDFAAGQGDNYDSCVIYAVDMNTAKPIFLYKSNQILIRDFVVMIKHLFKWIKSEIPDSVIILAPEVDGVGLAVIPELYQDPIIEPMLFRTLEYVDKKLAMPDLKAYSKKLDENTTIRYGVGMKKTWVDKQTMRMYLTNELMMLLANKYPYAFDFRDCFTEMKTLTINVTKTNRNRIEAKPPFHDDVIAAMLHAYSLLFYEKYREALYKWHKFHVDLMKFNEIPIAVQVIETKEDIETRVRSGINVEGSVSWKIINRINPLTMAPYEALEVTRIKDGIPVILTDEEVLDEYYNNPKLRHAMDNLKVYGYKDIQDSMKNSMYGVSKIDNVMGPDSTGNWVVTNRYGVELSDNRYAFAQQKKKDLLW
jgi:hypothetical protein